LEKSDTFLGSVVTPFSASSFGSLSRAVTSALIVEIAVALVMVNSICGRLRGWGVGSGGRPAFSSLSLSASLS
jgi:hypothetical protein